MKLSVIIPVLNDAACLEHLLDSLDKMDGVDEVLVVDGGSTDNLEAVISRHEVHFVKSQCGRGKQLDTGARLSRGEILWFLHADNTVHPKSAQFIKKLCSQKKESAGYFTFHIEEKRWYAKWLCWGVQARCHLLGYPYGDQGLFMARELYEKVGGFQDIPLLEDVELVGKLKSLVKLEGVPVPIGISIRRWEQEGFLIRTLKNWMILLGYMIGISPKRLKKLYQ